MTLYRLIDQPALDDPLMVVAFDAWVDAGSAATRAAAVVATDARTIADIETDRLYDYRARRPTLHIDDGRPRSLEWPSLDVVHRRYAGRDVLVLTGHEPDYRWQELSRDLADLARELGVTEWLTLGAIPAAVPHTRPVPVLGIASDDGLLRGGIVAGPDGSMQVPAAAVSVIDLAVAETGIPTVGYFAQVPHYVSGLYPAASVALIRALEHHIGDELPTALLEREAETVSARLDKATAADESTRSYVARLEEMSDEATLPSGGDLIEEIERFLRERGPEEDGTLR